jgi:two-component system OmpR family response regulator
VAAAKQGIAPFAGDGPDAGEEAQTALRALSDLVRIARSLEEGIEIARSRDFGVIVIDRFRNTQEKDAIVAAFRGHGVAAPMLFLSNAPRKSSKRAPERLADLSVAADFVACIGDLARLLDDISVAKLRFADVEMDLIKRTVKRGERTINLRPQEFKLLEFFLRRPGILVTSETLLDAVWRRRVPVNSNVIHVCIGQLRRKIDLPGERSIIVNIRGGGFMLGAA